MEWLGPSFFEVSFEDPFFRIVVYAVTFLFLLSVLFTLVAVSLRLRNDRRQARQEHLEAVWEPLVLDVLVGRRAPSVLLERVPERERFFFLEYLYRFARHLRGPELETIRSMAAPFLNEVARTAEEGNAEARARRLQIIGLLGFRTHTFEIVDALDDPSPLVAMVAVRALLHREHPEYVPAVLARLYRFGDWSHDLLASLLSGVGVSAAPPLRRLLGDPDQPSWLRCVAADALGRLNDLEAAEAAARLLAEGPEDHRLTVLLLHLLGRIGRPEDFPLVCFFSDAADPEVREYAIQALGATGRPDEVEAFFLRALEDTSPWVALQAARGLKRTVHIGVLRRVAASDHPRAKVAQQVLTERRAA